MLRDGCTDGLPDAAKVSAFNVELSHTPEVNEDGELIALVKEVIVNVEGNVSVSADRISVFSVSRHLRVCLHKSLLVTA